MKGECEFLVVLAYVPEEELTQLAAGLPEIDVILGGPTGQAMTPRMVGEHAGGERDDKGKFLVGAGCTEIKRGREMGGTRRGDGAGAGGISLSRSRM